MMASDILCAYADRVRRLKLIQPMLASLKYGVQEAQKRRSNGINPDQGSMFNGQRSTANVQLSCRRPAASKHESSPASRPQTRTNAHRAVFPSRLQTPDSRAARSRAPIPQGISSARAYSAGEPNGRYRKPPQIILECPPALQLNYCLLPMLAAKAANRNAPANPRTHEPANPHPGCTPAGGAHAPCDARQSRYIQH